jgi:succinate dehydrogenase / fumarate reductase flavoprotein subunit
MDTNAQVFRTAESLRQAFQDIQVLQERYSRVSVQDKGRSFNTDLIEALELGFLLDIAETVVVGALNRRESRGGHFREDYPKRDDEHFMEHTMAYRRVPGVPVDSPAGSAPKGEEVPPPGPGRPVVLLGTKPVVTTVYQPMERKY